jgi:hypothetical protein
MRDHFSDSRPGWLGSLWSCSEGTRRARVTTEEADNAWKESPGRITDAVLPMIYGRGLDTQLFRELCLRKMKAEALLFEVLAKGL